MGETVTAGGLEFYVENRAGGQDGGPSIQVRAIIDGKQLQILRFDMFHKQPHYHYAPTGQDLRYNLDPLTLDDGIDWVMNLFRTKLPQLVAKAGYEELASQISLSEATAALPEIERRWRAQS